MCAAGYEPTVLVRFFDRLKAVAGKSGDMSFLSSHPDTPERRDDVMRYVRELEDGVPAR